MGGWGGGRVRRVFFWGGATTFIGHWSLRVFHRRFLYAVGAFVRFIVNIFLFVD